jgi:hypothetical protein
MAYSNINRDEAQANVGKSIKTAILTIVLIVVILSAGTNVYNQWTTLRQAIGRNQEMGRGIKVLTEENRNMMKQIEYATSSANINRKLREYTGTGTSSDYWLLMPEEAGSSGITIEETAVIGEKPVIVQWWNLFTK